MATDYPQCDYTGNGSTSLGILFGSKHYCHLYTYKHQRFGMHMYIYSNNHNYTVQLLPCIYMHGNLTALHIDGYCCVNTYACQTIDVYTYISGNKRNF